MLSDTEVERRSDREIVATRTIDGAARLVFEAWTNPALFQRWWVPKSFPIELRACEMDVRAGGRYRLDYAFGDQVSSFFGTYVEVSPPSRLVWTNDESDEGVTVTTVTFEEEEGRTRLTMVDRYPSKEVLDAAIAEGSTSISATPETFDQLAAMLSTPFPLDFDLQSADPEAYEVHLVLERARKTARLDALRRVHGHAYTDDLQLTDEDEALLDRIWERIRNGEDPRVPKSDEG